MFDGLLKGGVYRGLHRVVGPNSFKGDIQGITCGLTIGLIKGEG